MVLYRTIGWFYIELSNCRVRTGGHRHGDGVTCGVVTVAKKVAWARGHRGGMWILVHGAGATVAGSA